MLTSSMRAMAGRRAGLWVDIMVGCIQPIAVEERHPVDSVSVGSHKYQVTCISQVARTTRQQFTIPIMLPGDVLLSQNHRHLLSLARSAFAGASDDIMAAQFSGPNS